MSEPASNPFVDKVPPVSFLDIVSALPGFERRLSARHASEEDALCHLGGAGGHECRWAWVVNVSRAGIGLRLAGGLRPGSRLALEFPEAPSPLGRLPRVRVVHCAELGDGTWLVGCRFDAPLADHELRAIAGA